MRSKIESLDDMEAGKMPFPAPGCTPVDAA
jgi:hypothetical protein